MAHSLFKTWFNMCPAWILYAIFNGVSYISLIQSPLLIAQIIDIKIQYQKHIKWACWDKQLMTVGRKRDVMEAGEFAFTGNSGASLVSPGWFGGGQDMLPVL